jgi:plastocyanin
MIHPKSGRVGASIAIGIVVLMALLLSACGGPSGSSISGPTETVVVNDGMSFLPDHLTISVGTTTIRIKNVGSIPHNLDIPALHAASPTVDGGQTVTMTVHAKKAGTYPFVCTLHVMNGMVGTLVVRPAKKR